MFTIDVVARIIFGSTPEAANLLLSSTLIGGVMREELGERKIIDEGIETAIRHPTHSSTLRRLAAQATIYILWYERNSRLHNNMSSSPAALFKQLDRLIKDSILARRKMKAFGGLLRRWLAFA
ncbi:hypothetical protein IGI04_001181 [Brassica rapa subsp. trilocularis]|uniref:Uncharacterized protein n=1 Tax=Brassica rapa subsp. trilocularis TaxID=1813537 RepID=A0ABQ7NRW6_BRACM|nr:hypothetical protein IGI04_001181 [Brassica rapa subsp. trilocularis]